MTGLIIPKEQAPKYRKILLNWFTGIDAVELEDGTFFISKECYDMLPEGFEITRDEEKFNVKTELSKLTARKILSSEFKVSEIDIITEPSTKKK